MRFWIVTKNGVRHEGVNIQGSGGILAGKGAPARLELAIVQATSGDDTGLYEPMPGHVLGFFAKARGPVEPRNVDLRGARLERAADEPLPDFPEDARGKRKGLRCSCMHRKRGALDPVGAMVQDPSCPVHGSGGSANMPPFPPEVWRGDPCIYGPDYDPATLAPRGPRCGAPAMQVIYWHDGRFSPACAQHGFDVLTPETQELVLCVRPIEDPIPAPITQP